MSNILPLFHAMFALCLKCQQQPQVRDIKKVIISHQNGSQFSFLSFKWRTSVLHNIVKEVIKCTFSMYQFRIKV